MDVVVGWMDGVWGVPPTGRYCSLHADQHCLDTCKLRKFNDAYLGHPWDC